MICVCVLGVLRAAIWAGAAVVDGFEQGAAGSVRIGRWEDGGSVSRKGLLAGAFTRFLACPIEAPARACNHTLSVVRLEAIIQK